jgi:hypothetical protein
MGWAAAVAYTSAMTTTDSLAERRRSAQDALALIRRLRRQGALPDLDAARLIAEVRAEAEAEGTEGAPTQSG